MTEEVKKLDIPSRFNDITTGLKTMRSLKKHEKERYSVWWNYFKETGSLKLPKQKNDILWVDKHWKTIEAYITANYGQEDQKHSTYRNHLEGLANVLLAINKVKHKENVRHMFVTGLQLQKGLDEKQEDNELTESERKNFICFENIIEERTKLEEAWRKDIKNAKLNMYHLILAFNSYIPPLRLNLIDMEIHRDRKEPPSNVETNYLWEKTPGKWHIVINYDKIEHRRVDKGLDREIFDLSDEIAGVTNGKKLNTIINDSLKALRREYVLVGVRSTHTPMGKSSYNKALSSVFSPRSPTQNIFRKSYINYWHNKKLPTSKLKEIARRQRHTLGVALSAYKKVDIDCDDVDVDGLEIKEKIEIPKPVPKKKEDYFDPKKYAKEYREKHKTELDKKRKEQYEKNKENILKNKMLWHLNKGLVAYPRQSSIEKYSLEYDTKLRKWI